MKGKIKKTSFGYVILYYPTRFKVENFVAIYEEDMDEFMDDIYSQHLKNKANKKQVITKQEKAEQDKDELEIEELEKLRKECKLEMDNWKKTKIYDNPFPTEEQLNYDINVRERD